MTRKSIRNVRAGDDARQAQRAAVHEELHGKIVVEEGFRFLKRDLVLSDVRRSFGCVSFELHAYILLRMAGSLSRAAF